MEPESSLLPSQEATSGTYLQRHESIPPPCVLIIQDRSQLHTFIYILDCQAVYFSDFWRNFVFISVQLIMFRYCSVSNFGGNRLAFSVDGTCYQNHQRYDLHIHEQTEVMTGGVWLQAKWWQRNALHEKTAQRCSCSRHATTHSAVPRDIHGLLLRWAHRWDLTPHCQLCAQNSVP
jgi:hypothetical protein